MTAPRNGALQKCLCRCGKRACTGKECASKKQTSSQCPLSHQAPAMCLAVRTERGPLYPLLCPMPGRLPLIVRPSRVDAGIRHGSAWGPEQIKEPVSPARKYPRTGRRIPPSAGLRQAIAHLLADGVGDEGHPLCALIRL